MAQRAGPGETLTTMRRPIPIYAIALPEYTAEREPDYRVVGTQLDQVIETHFSGKPMAIRGISLVDHPDWSLEDLVDTILKLGTDRYDPDRQGVHYPASSSLLDIFACTFAVVAGSSSLHTIRATAARPAARWAKWSGTSITAHAWIEVTPSGWIC
jgi:hypothetical protein